MIAAKEKEILFRRKISDIFEHFSKTAPSNEKIKAAQDMFEDIVQYFALADKQTILQIMIPTDLVPRLVYLSEPTGKRIALAAGQDIVSKLKDATASIQARIYLHPDYFLNARSGIEINWFDRVEFSCDDYFRRLNALADFLLR